MILPGNRGCRHLCGAAAVSDDVTVTGVPSIFCAWFCAVEADHRCFKQIRLGTRGSGLGARGSSDVVSGGQPDLSPHIPKITKVRQSFALCVMIPDHNDPE